MFGFDAKVINETTGTFAKPMKKGMLMLAAPLPPGCLTTVWRNDERFINGYFSLLDGKQYATSDYADG